MTAAGHMSRTIRDDLHGVSAPILLAKYPQFAYIYRLSTSPDNTSRRKAGLGHTGVRRDDGTLETGVGSCVKPR